MDTTTPHRARSMAELAEFHARTGRFRDIAASVASYRPLPSDVIITPYGKCGTTWLQQTFHTLRTRGDMDFDDISRVVPWIEMATICDLDINAPQRAEPRGFKSHLAFDKIPKGARYVVSLRDPKDALVSMYHFMEGWYFEPGTIGLADFAQPRITATDGSDYWHHLLTWWAERDNPCVLMFSYEQMSAEPEASIRRLAKFCGIALDDELLALTLERSSLRFMLAHKDRFDDFMMRRISEEKGGLPPGSDSAKVRAGKVGSHKAEMPASLAAQLDAIWAERVAPVTGFASYAELEAALRQS